MMFMKNERYLIKKIIEKVIGSFVFPILIVLVMPFIMGFYYERNIYVKLNDITVELGDKLPDEITNYMSLITDKSNLTIESSVPLDSNGNTTMIGKFNYYLAYNDADFKFTKLTNAKSTITVIDTIKPVIKLKENVKIEYNGKLTPDLVAECNDLSGCKMEITDKIDTTKSGEYEVNIVASDGGNNKSYAKTKVTVIEKPKPKPVYSYNPYAGVGKSKMDEINNQKNATLSEEEKSSLRNQIAAYARQFVGNPYVYGGTSLTKGTDCSGFTMSIYANYGYALPRTAPSQAYIGTPVSASQLLPGDIVVYSGHVGLYVGNGMMVHASTPKAGIIYDKVYSGVIGYRRIIV